MDQQTLQNYTSHLASAVAQARQQETVAGRAEDTAASRHPQDTSRATASLEPSRAAQQPEPLALPHASSLLSPQQTAAMGLTAMLQQAAISQQQAADPATRALLQQLGVLAAPTPAASSANQLERLLLALAGSAAQPAAAPAALAVPTDALTQAQLLQQLLLRQQQPATQAAAAPAPAPAAAGISAHDLLAVAAFDQLLAQRPGMAGSRSSRSFASAPKLASQIDLLKQLQQQQQLQQQLAARQPEPAAPLVRMPSNRSYTQLTQLAQLAQQEMLGGPAATPLAQLLQPPQPPVVCTGTSTVGAQAAKMQQVAASERPPQAAPSRPPSTRGSTARQEQAAATGRLTRPSSTCRLDELAEAAAEISKDLDAAGLPDRLPAAAPAPAGPTASPKRTSPKRATSPKRVKAASPGSPKEPAAQPPEQPPAAAAGALPRRSSGRPGGAGSSLAAMTPDAQLQLTVVVCGVIEGTLKRLQQHIGSSKGGSSSSSSGPVMMIPVQSVLPIVEDAVELVKGRVAEAAGLVPGGSAAGGQRSLVPELRMLDAIVKMMNQAADQHGISGRGGGAGAGAGGGAEGGGAKAGPRAAGSSSGQLQQQAGGAQLAEQNGAAAAADAAAAAAAAAVQAAAGPMSAAAAAAADVHPAILEAAAAAAMSAPGLLPLQGSQALLLAGAGLPAGEAGPPVGGPEDRAMRVLRYKQKRMQRTFKKQVRYESRSELANSRQRFKGRFVSKVEPDGTGGSNSGAGGTSAGRSADGEGGYSDDDTHPDDEEEEGQQAEGGEEGEEGEGQSRGKGSHDGSAAAGDGAAGEEAAAAGGGAWPLGLVLQAAAAAGPGQRREEGRPAKRQHLDDGGGSRAERDGSAALLALALAGLPGAGAAGQ